LIPEIKQVVDNANDNIDSYTSSFLSKFVDKAWEQKEESSLKPEDIYFPAAFADDEQRDPDTVDVHCFSAKVPKSGQDKKVQQHFELLRYDDYFGDIGFCDDVFFYGGFSDGCFGSSFNENAKPPVLIEWHKIEADSVAAARNYFTGMIGHPLYGIEDIKSLQAEQQKPTQDSVLKKKQLHQWESVQVDQLRKNKNQIISQLLGSGAEGDESDLWITLIAFSGYGAHRTNARKTDGRHPTAFFVNDVTFLDQYEVRKGYVKYGAKAFFTAKYQLAEIYLSHTGKLYKAPDLKIGDASNDDARASKLEWKHAKWAWKVSLSVAIFLVDHLAHNQLRESNGLIKALRKLPEDHPLRRFMLPFTFGTAHRSRVMNEYLRRYGLYHRAFAFKYEELQRLIRDSMMNAPPLPENKNQQTPRPPRDLMKYRFRLFKKKVNVKRKLAEEIHSLYTDSWDLWVHSLHFVKKYLNSYYGLMDSEENKKLEGDKDLQNFYSALQQNLNIDTKFRIKSFNVVNLMAHFICTATVWNHHLHSAVSFVYSVDPDFTGLKILGNNATMNNVQNYAEYCCVVMSKGWNEPDLNKPDVWKRVIKDDENRKANEKEFRDFFEDKMRQTAKANQSKNSKRIAPNSTLSPQFLQSSARL